MQTLFKLETYVPLTHRAELKAALSAAGAGRLGDYDSCIWETDGVGQFRPLAGSNPAIGVHDRLETVPECKLEMLVAGCCLDAVLAALHRVHPYETPAVQYWAVQTGAVPE